MSDACGTGLSGEATLQVAHISHYNEWQEIPGFG
jgi:hypothetical protein